MEDIEFIYSRYLLNAYTIIFCDMSRSNGVVHA